MEIEIKINILQLIAAKIHWGRWLDKFYFSTLQ